MTKIIFDVGAYDGKSSVEIVNQNYKGDSNFRVWLFEPHPFFAKKLKINFGIDPRFQVIEKAVCEMDGKSNLNMSRGDHPETIGGGSSSLLDFKSNAEIDLAWNGSSAKNMAWDGNPHPLRPDLHYTGNSISVDTIRLDTFIKINNIEKIDFLHIDAQGCDLEVLKSLGGYIGIVDEGVCEAAYDLNSAIYSTQKYFLQDIKNWLIENGFELISVNPNVPYAADSKNENEWNIYFRRKTNV